MNQGAPAGPAFGLLRVGLEADLQDLVEEGDQFLGAVLFGDELGGTGLAGKLVGAGELKHGGRHDGQGGGLRAQGFDEVQAAGILELNVGDNEVRPQRGDGGEGGRHILGLAANGHLGIAGDGIDDAAAHEVMVVHDKYS